METLQLNPITLNKEYMKEWNIDNNDFFWLAKNGMPLRNTLYRKGGMSNPNISKDKYFILLKYTKELYTSDFIKGCYPDKSHEEQQRKRKHLMCQSVILDSNGDEKLVAKQFDHIYLVDPNSCIYSCNSNYYNIETGYCYGDSTYSLKSKEFIFVNNYYDKDASKCGVIKINKQDGSWELFPR